MAALDGTIEMVMSEYRPCIVRGNKKALFHRWSDKSELIGPHLIRHTVAIVEFENGSVSEQGANDIKFLDSDFMFERSKNAN